MARKSKETTTRTVAVEISRSTLGFVSVEQRGDATPQVQTRTIVWRREASSLHSAVGLDELSTAMKTLVREEKLAGLSVRLVLSGEFCVTRVLAGSNERVRQEMAALEDRSQRYLSLGPGRKALAGSSRQIDARHQHALLSVANQKTVEAAQQVAAAAGVRIERIEPSLVALSRLLGRMEYDRDQPTLVVKLDEKGVELGISHQGRLLLDYRPGGKAVQAEAAGIIVEHLARLKRYCFRYFRFAQGELKRVYICGESNLAEQVRRDFQRFDQLEVEVLDLRHPAAQWKLTSDNAGGELASALGACLDGGEEDAASSPNLMLELSDQVQRPLAGLVLRSLWPLAATILIAIGVFAIVRGQRVALESIEQELAQLDPVRTESLQLQMTLASAAAKQEFLGMIAERVSSPDWSGLITIMAGCLPDDVWLNRFELQADNTVHISGASFSEDGVYEFVNWLKKSPLFSHVALEGTGPVQDGKGMLTNFDLTCKLKVASSEAKNSTDDEAKGAKHDH